METRRPLFRGRPCGPAVEPRDLVGGDGRNPHLLSVL